MSRHDDRITILQLLDYAVEAVEMARSRTRKDLDDDRMFDLSVRQLLEIIGEAARRVSPDTRASCPGVAWSEMIAVRNRIAHGYDEVNFDRVWEIVQDDLPSLIAELRRILAMNPSPIKPL